MAAVNNLSVLVTDATGYVGSLVVKALDDSKITVKAAVTAKEKEQASSLPSSVKVVEVDTNQVESLVDALKGVSTVVFISTLAEDQQAVVAGWVKAFNSPALQNGDKHQIQHIVRLSLVGAEDPHFMFAHWHAWDEVLVSATNIPSTVVRPSVLLQEFMSFFAQHIKADGVFTAPFPDLPVSYIDANDIAKALAKIATAPHGTYEPIYTLYGPQAVKHEELVAAISSSAGKEIKYKECTIFEFARLLLKWGIPEVLADGFCELYVGNKDQKVFATTDSGEIKKLIGDEPRTLSQYLQEHASLFH